MRLMIFKTDLYIAFILFSDLSSTSVASDPTFSPRPENTMKCASQVEKHLVFKKVCFVFFSFIYFSVLYLTSMMVLFNLLGFLRVEQTLSSIFKKSQPLLSPTSWPWDLRRIQFTSTSSFFYQYVIPCKSACSLGAFYKLLKAHFVFGTSYNIMLHNMYTFIQTTVYKIDVDNVKESSRVAEVRSGLLSWVP